MEKAYYTINDLAVRTMLSTRTICNYIKMGFIQGEKQEGIWLFTKEAIQDFLEEPYVKESIAIKKKGLLNDFVEGKNPGCVCSIYDYVHESKEEVMAYCTLLIQKINALTNFNIKFCFEYDEVSKITRIIIQGEIGVVQQIMQEVIA